MTMIFTEKKKNTVSSQLLCIIILIKLELFKQNKTTPKPNEQISNKQTNKTMNNQTNKNTPAT